MSRQLGKVFRTLYGGLLWTIGAIVTVLLLFLVVWFWVSVLFLDAMFNKGEGGFLDRDLYPFCANLSDGKLLAVANPNAKQLLGTDVRELKDVTGKVYGKEMFEAAQKPDGTITEVSYMFARPSDPKPVAKVSFVTKVGDIYCGVGYYKQ